MQAAAKRYFNTTADQLNIVRSATIAAITRIRTRTILPSESDQPESEKQRNIVLQLMNEQGYIFRMRNIKEAVNTPAHQMQRCPAYFHRLHGRGL